MAMAEHEYLIYLTRLWEDTLIFKLLDVVWANFKLITPDAGCCGGSQGTCSDWLAL
jgi:hypothetical protein